MNIVKSALNLFGISKDDEGGVPAAKSLDEFLEGLPPLLGYDVSFVRHQKDDGSHHVEVGGSEVTSLLGEDTQILDAIAHISMRVLRKQEGIANKSVDDGTEMSKYRVTVDAEGFRDRHYEGLKKMAEDARKKVLDNNGRPAYLSALSPAERRIIHTHLATLGDVTSESIGNGTFKRIRIKLIVSSGQAGPESPRPRGGGHRRGPQGGSNFRKGKGPRGSSGGPTGNRGPARGSGGGVNVRRARFADEYAGDEEINGNVAPPEETKSADDDFDDNIGNR